MNDIVKFTFGLADQGLEDDEREKFAKNLLPELRDLDEVEKAYPAKNPSPEKNTKEIGSLLSMLTAEVSIKNVSSFFAFLYEKISRSNKPIEIVINIPSPQGQQEVKLIAKHKELKDAEATVLKILAEMRGEING